MTTSLNADVRADAVEWDDERDVRELRVRYRSAPPPDAKVEYWFRNWPYPPPRMPTMEDPVDDLWQGKWLVAESSRECSGAECVYTFQPLTEGENPLAKNLPGSRYRRTLKIRLISSAEAPAVSSRTSALAQQRAVVTTDTLISRTCPGHHENYRYRSHSPAG